MKLTRAELLKCADQLARHAVHCIGQSRVIFAARAELAAWHAARMP